MDFFTSPADVSEGFGPSAVTIGKFDGVHLGHRAVIADLERTARDRDLVSAVVTFDRHPLSILRPDAVPVALTSNQQKRELLEQTGVEATLMLTFDHHLQSLSPEEFVDTILVDTLQAEVVLVGTDFRFGVRGSGTIETLRELGAHRGFEVRIVPDVVLDSPPGDGTRRVSSSWVRELLDEGRIADATVLLGRRPAVRGVVVHGERRGRELGFPTANLEPRSEGFVPADGIYAARVTVGGEVYDSAVSVGNNPTFDGVPEKQVEAHLLDVKPDLYGKEVTVYFHDWIRGNVKFEGLDALVVQIANDVEAVRQLLASERV
ncbi:bifunctional riboflavin kinase/FMN adenylyltransferase [Frondihabitans sp. PAMC 28766]|uniref:bifunctional riboflavin kinase/FAD synthetase n=1 Tax=Frondihabitans sp. PAMC 28766 TaxID=1795630 RepID=UPI00078E7FE1|nr:bifunctional riboflavin kinase/FAD synthetase [Frondihabitans sp. PAMC 28766]AMM21120.1 bifunctional riboflavin kinase/FMN adenylyltransferase [Frondihabitans sp. PAMC 28766]